MITIGRSTVAQLINRAKNMNEYNNSGVSNDSVWCDHMNSALIDMAGDIKLDETTTITFTPGTNDYDLPEDFYELLSVSDGPNRQVSKRRSFDQEYPPGYWVINKGDKYILNFRGYSSPTEIEIYYYRYPAVLEIGQIDTQKPEIQTAAENALVMKAISHSLRNNNQIGQAQYYDQLYKTEVAKVNTASMKARG